MVNDPNLTRLNDLLTQPDQLGTVIDELIALSADYPRYNDFLLLKSRYNRTERDYRSHTVTREDYQVELNRLIQSVRYFMELLDRERTPHHPIVNEPPTVLPPIPVETEATLTESKNEAILGVNNFRNIFWLQNGLSCAESVCRVLMWNGGYGTGFLFDDDLMMTCNHVIPNANAAAQTWVEFNYQEGASGKYERSFRYKVKELIVTDDKLDYTVVKIDSNGAERPLLSWGKLMLNASATPVYKELATIIQHPNGGLKRIVLTNSYIVRVAPPNLVYVTDTLAGSSGSPVFNDVWQVIGVHKKSEQQSKGELLNVGTLMSAVIKDARVKGFTIK